jgi:hypothetical protein
MGRLGEKLMKQRTKFIQRINDTKIGFLEKEIILQTLSQCE